MPGLFLAIAVFAAFAMAGKQVASVAQKKRLTAGTWLLDVSFLTAPDRARFEDVFRGASSGYQVDNITWTTPVRAALTVTVPPGELVPVMIDVGTPSPSASFAITSASPTPRPSYPALGPASTAVSGTPNPLKAWSLGFQTSTSIFDKPSFEEALSSRLSVRQVVRMHWSDSRHLSVVVIARSSLGKHIGRTIHVRDVPTTLTRATRIPTER